MRVHIYKGGIIPEGDYPARITDVIRVRQRLEIKFRITEGKHAGCSFTTSTRGRFRR